MYPAGFLYIYAAIKRITGGAVFPAQIVFGVLYVVNLGLVLWIYIRVQVVPWWALSLLCLSKRVHSIFVLRLFNDCVATTLTHASIALMLQQHWHLALSVFSAAVSVKMNVLLFAPPLLLLLLKSLTIPGVLTSLACAALFQVLVGMPFLLTYPVEYLSRAFNLGRVFIHFWSVNFKFFPEDVFISKPFALSLLILHLAFLYLFAQYKWCRHEGGVLQASGLKEVKEHNRESGITIFKRFFRISRPLSDNRIQSIYLVKFCLLCGILDSFYVFHLQELSFASLFFFDKSAFRYRHCTLQWEFHRHCLCTVIALPVLLMVFL